MITDTSASPCPNNSSPGQAAASAAASTSVQTRHPRIDLAAAMPKLQLEALGKSPADVMLFDERYTAQITEAQRVALNSAHTIDSPTFKHQARRFICQLLSAVAAILNALYAATAAPGDQTKDFEVTHKLVVKDQPAASKIKASALLMNSLIFVMTARGLFDRSESLQILQNHVFRPNGKGNGGKFIAHSVQWLKGMHTAVREDCATVRDVLERPERFFAPLQFLEQNPFTVLGAATTTNDAPAARHFFRTELPREVAEAKKIGWKPQEAQQDGAGAAAPSPTASRTGQGGDAKDGQGKPPPRKRGRSGGRGGGDRNKDAKDKEK
jgi:hypothetical protein